MIKKLSIVFVFSIFFSAFVEASCLPVGADLRSIPGYIESYRSTISDQDRKNSSGKPVKGMKAFLQQDRANVNHFDRGDPQDQKDNYFATLQNRQLLQSAKYAGRCGKDYVQLINALNQPGQNATVDVHIVKQENRLTLYVELVDLNASEQSKATYQHRTPNLSTSVEPLDSKLKVKQKKLSSTLDSALLKALLKNPPLRGVRTNVRDKYISFQTAHCNSLAQKYVSVINEIFPFVAFEKAQHQHQKPSLQSCQLRVTKHTKRGELAQLQFFKNEAERLDFNSRKVSDLIAPGVSIASLSLAKKGGVDLIMVEPNADERFRRQCFSSSGDFRVVDWGNLCGSEGLWAHSIVRDAELVSNTEPNSKDMKSSNVKPNEDSSQYLNLECKELRGSSWRFFIRHLSKNNAILIFLKDKMHNSEVMSNVRFRSTDSRFNYDTSQLERIMSSGAVKYQVRSLYVDRVSGKLHVRTQYPNPTYNFSLYSSDAYACSKIGDKRFDRQLRAIHEANSREADRKKALEEKKRIDVQNKRKF